MNLVTNSLSFVPVLGGARDISIGADGTTFVIGASAAGPAGNFGIYKLNAGSFLPFPGAAVKVAVDPAGVPWVLNAAGAIFKWERQCLPPKPGSAIDIAIGAEGSVWVIGSNNGIYKLAGGSFLPVPGSANKIGVGADGNPWVINASPGHLPPGRRLLPTDPRRRARHRCRSQRSGLGHRHCCRGPARQLRHLPANQRELLAGRGCGHPGCSWWAAGSSVGTQCSTEHLPGHTGGAGPAARRRRAASAAPSPATAPGSDGRPTALPLLPSLRPPPRCCRQPVAQRRTRARHPQQPRALGRERHKTRLLLSPLSGAARGVDAFSMPVKAT